MNKNRFAADLAWRQASAAAMDFWNKHSANWSDQVDAQYRALADARDRLFVKRQAILSGRSASQVEASINDNIHSARD